MKKLMTVKPDEEGGKGDEEEEGERHERISVRRVRGKTDTRLQNAVKGGMGKSACNGDSGGPLVCQGEDGKWYQVETGLKR